jgi:biopolymer transport protein TolQ
MPHTLFLLVPANANGDFVYLIKNASLLAKLVLLLLLMFSVVSWAVIIFKSLEYSRARKNSLKFLEHFRKMRNFSEISRMTPLFINNPLGEIFKFGYREMTLQLGPNPDSETIDTECIQRALLRGSNAEISHLERLNGFLATTATVTPFIGLFGTVWGIMSSFQNIGLMQNTSLGTVAPGIAEALIATAMGLFAAIPAVIFYNLLLNRLKILIAMMEDFMLDFLNLSKKIQP